MTNGACVAKDGRGMHGKGGNAWQRGACMARGRGMHAGETATEAGSTDPTGMHSC